MNNNGQPAGAGWEMREEERREYQNTHTAWARRKKDEIVTVKDLKLWKKRKRQIQREKDKPLVILGDIAEFWGDDDE